MGFFYKWENYFFKKQMYTLSKIQNKQIAVVDMLNEKNNLFSDIVHKTILKYKKNWKKILFVSNRKWYASSNLCLDCGHIPKCKNCDIPIAQYVCDDQFVYMCPICKTVYENLKTCQNCDSCNIKEVWIWTYKLAQILKETYNITANILENTDLNSQNKIIKANKTLQESQFIISTSILSSENPFFSPDIVIFINADTWLTMPDFNACEKHFLFLYEFIKKYKTQNFIIQTFNPNHYVYCNILKLDLNWFWKKELKIRESFNYPPFCEIAMILYKSEIENRVYNKISKLESELRYLAQTQDYKIEIFPTPALIFKKFWKYHYNILLKWKNLKSFLDLANSVLKMQNRGFQIDRLPNNVI